MLAYVSYEKLLRKLLPPRAGAFAFQIGFSDPIHAGPNIYSAGNPTQPPSTSGLLEDYEHNEGGLLDAAERLLTDYARRDVDWTAVRDGPSGTMIDSGWHTWQNRVPWSPQQRPQDDDWGIENPGVVYHPPSPDWDCASYIRPKEYPWCAPYVFSGYWETYQNCIDPANYGGTCPSHPPLNPWGVDCPSCSDLGIWRMSAFPVNCNFLTMVDAGGTELLAAARFNGNTWQRIGGYLASRYRGRWGVGESCSSEFVYRAARWLFLDEPMPWTEWRCALLSARPADGQTTEDAALAFDELKAADTWTVQGYADPALPFGKFVPGGPWVNERDEAVTVRWAAIVGLNADGAWELLFWGGVDEATRQPNETYTLDSFRFRIEALSGV